MSDFIVFEDRPTDSPWLERVWRCRSERAGDFTSMAASQWEMVVTRLRGDTTMTVRGPETFATSARCPGEGEWLGIRFKLGTFLPQFPMAAILDRNDAILTRLTTRSFRLNGASFEYPTFENVETFVARLVRDGLLTRDPIVDSMRHGADPRTSERTAQRRFLRATGISHAAFTQIERARRATELLRGGAPIVDAAHRAGYFDQAHLTRAVKRLIGKTPGQIARGDSQLSFLYKTDAS